LQHRHSFDGVLAADALGGRRPLRIWAMTTGEAGMRVQARGLAHAVGGLVEEKIIGLRKPWSFFPGALTPAPLLGLDPAKDRLQAPWPDLLVTCGRRSAAASIAIRRASGGRTLTVHVQNPRTEISAFDLVVAMEHDGLDGPNVVSVPTALHDITPARLAAAAELWRERLAPLGRPLAGVVLGGSTRRRPFTRELARALIAELDELGAGGAGLAITASRRTPPGVRALFAERFAGAKGAWMWNMQGENPYLGLLALADRLVVTSDSVTMVSEALATERPVEVFDLKAGRRHARFLDTLVSLGLVRRLTPEGPPPAPNAAVNFAPLAAEAVRRLLRAREWALIAG
jgi:mitochondrial fission protein ELM1